MPPRLIREYGTINPHFRLPRPVSNPFHFTLLSMVMPTVIVALSAHHALSPAVIDSDSKQSLQEEEERP